MEGQQDLNSLFNEEKTTQADAKASKDDGTISETKEQIKSKQQSDKDDLDRSKDKLDSFFTDYLKKDPIFKDKSVLQLKYIPDMILHREKQVELLASILAPALRQEKPSNLFIYGKTGTGKTLCVKHILDGLVKTAVDNKVPLRTVYINCKLKKIADTEYRIIAQLGRELGVDIPMTGLPTDEVYNLFLKEVNKEKQVVVLVLDEVDRLVAKTGDEILYNLTRINSELTKSDLSIVGISNDVRFIDNVDPRVKSSLGEEEVVFPPYNALELKDILDKRSLLAFREGVVYDGVLEKCSAYAAREHGDARRALDLLRVAAEVAERGGASTIEPKHIDMAEDKIEKNRIEEIVKTQPKQSQAVMFAIFQLLFNKKDHKVETGEVFDRYKQVCNEGGFNILTQRRISDLISELDMLGIINAQVVSKGRYGRTRDIYLAIPDSMVEKLMKQLEEEVL